MFSNYQQARTSIDTPPYQSGRTTALAAYDQGIAKNNERANPFALSGKGIGAGSGVNMFRKGLFNQRGIAEAQSGYQNARMNALEQNRAAQLQADQMRAGELAQFTAQQQDLEQADVAEQLGKYSLAQQLEMDNRKRAAQNASRYAGLLGGLLGGAMGTARSSGFGGLLSSLI